VDRLTAADIMPIVPATSKLGVRVTALLVNP
jgi:hypothetical protein